MIRSAAASLYGAAAHWRRRWYAGDPSRQRRLTRPVVSVGNLRAGGSGKTPIVAHLAQILLLCGERPAILSRGYGRNVPSDGVTVVSDGTRMLAGFDTAGDEPLMLARALPEVPVLVGADRHLSGRMAEERFHATVHLLDDGFQHLALGRDVDLLAVSVDDLDEGVIPSGQLREPLAAAAAADALLVSGDSDEETRRLERTLKVARSFQVRRSIGEPHFVRAPDRGLIPSSQRVFAFAGIARPERFFDALSAAGWRIAGTRVFRDHYAYSSGDLLQILDETRACGAAVALTTEKDAVRCDGLIPNDALIGAVPLTARVEPAETFREWLLERIRR